MTDILFYKNIIYIFQRTYIIYLALYHTILTCNSMLLHVGHSGDPIDIKP